MQLILSKQVSLLQDIADAEFRSFFIEFSLLDIQYISKLFGCKEVITHSQFSQHLIGAADEGLGWLGNEESGLAIVCPFPKYIIIFLIK